MFLFRNENVNLSFELSFVIKLAIFLSKSVFLIKFWRSISHRPGATLIKILRLKAVRIGAVVEKEARR